jgi:pimeloyl-ACP methyl ester carboxylesterase
MWEETARLNLFDLAPALEMPVLFFLGRNDHWVPPEAGLAYFEALRAPQKELVWFERSGHEPFVDEPAKFNAAMAELALPVVATDPSAGAA